MLRIRLSMGGVRKRPIYKIVIADSRYPRDGKFIEKIGSYNPLLPKEKKRKNKNRGGTSKILDEQRCTANNESIKTLRRVRNYADA